VSQSRTCRVCGCSDFDPCPGGCAWAGDDLCSRCAPPAAAPPATGPFVGVSDVVSSIHLPCADCGAITAPEELAACGTCGTAKLCLGCRATDVEEGFVPQCLSCFGDATYFEGAGGE
jgi:hypothetical protein